MNRLKNHMLPSTILTKLKMARAEFLVGLVFIACLGKVYLSICNANLDLTIGRFALHMDEQLLYDGVFKILHPKNIGSFFFNVFDGFDHRYGRVFWYAYSIVCFLPEIILGPKGLIFFSRMLSVLLLSASCLILCNVFLKTFFFRLFAFFIFINLPFSSYYMTMPKPEPLQLLFLSLFFVFFKKNKYSLNKKHWVFLGLSFGTKVSMFPVVITTLMFSLYHSFLTEKPKKPFSKALTAIFYIILGLSIAVPVLLIQYLFSVLLYFLLIKLISKALTATTSHKAFLITTLFFANLFYSFIIKKLYGTSSGLVIWFDQTFLGVGHGYDNADVDFFKWVEYLMNEHLSPFLTINTILFALSFFVVIFFLKTKKTISDFGKGNPSIPEALLLVLLGLSLFFAVFFASNRISGFYLFPGSVLLVLGLISSCEGLLKAKQGAKKMHGNKIAFLFVVCLSGVALFLWLPQNLKTLEGLAKRTKSPEHKTNYSSYLQINDFLTFYSKEKNRKIHIKNIGSPYVPNDNEYFSIQDLFRPFTSWDRGFEALLVKDIGSVSIKKINPSFFNYALRVEEKKGYDKYVVNFDENCSSKECYKKIKTFRNGTEFLVLNKSID